MKHNSECCIFIKGMRFCSCIDWELTEDEINDLVDQWHENDHSVQLHTWLGLTWSSFQDWVRSPV